MADSIQRKLDQFNPSQNQKADIGQIVIFYDARNQRSEQDRTSILHNVWFEAKYRLGWPSIWRTELDPGNLRLIWYTHAGSEGVRDFPLWKAYAVLEMFEELASQGFRPMVMGWSGENPFPMLGGSEPPAEPKKNEAPRTKTWSGAVSGHGKAGTTPHDRVMAIIDDEEKKEAEKRRKQVEEWEKQGGGVEGAA